MRFVLLFSSSELGKKQYKQECIPVGCVPPAAIAVWGVGVGGHGLHQAPQVAFWCGGLLLWPSGVVPSGVVAFCYGLLAPEDHTRRPPSIRRPPNQKAITEGHNRRPQQKAITEGHTLAQAGTPLGPGTHPGTRHPPPQDQTPWEQTPQEQTPPPGDLLQGMLGYHLQGMLGYPRPTVNRIFDTRL